MTISEKLIKIAENEPKVYESGVEKGKSELAESLNAPLDEISATLDEMLTLQESLIPKLPTFTIEYNRVTYTFEYEENMTWGVWCASEYNTGIQGDKLHINDMDALMCSVSYVYEYSNMFGVYKFDKISNYDRYYMM